MTSKELYDFITERMTAEEALMNLLEGHVMTYNKLKFDEGEEVHPIILISMAAMDMGWDIATPDGDSNATVEGMIVGNETYITKILK